MQLINVIREEEVFPLNQLCPSPNKHEAFMVESQMTLIPILFLRNSKRI